MIHLQNPTHDSGRNRIPYRIRDHCNAALKQTFGEQKKQCHPCNGWNWRKHAKNRCNPISRFSGASCWDASQQSDPVNSSLSEFPAQSRRMLRSKTNSARSRSGLGNMGGPKMPVFCVRTSSTRKIRKIAVYHAERSRSQFNTELLWMDNSVKIRTPHIRMPMNTGSVPDTACAFGTV